MFIAESRTFGFQNVFAHAVFFKMFFFKWKATKGVKRLYSQQRYLLNDPYTVLVKITQWNNPCREYIRTQLIRSLKGGL